VGTKATTNSRPESSRIWPAARNTRSARRKTRSCCSRFCWCRRER